jgi:hypothetical protein
LARQNNPQPKFDDISKGISLKSFTYQISTEIWKLIQHTSEGEKNDLIKAAKSQINDDLKKIEEYFYAHFACRKDKPQVKGRIRYNKLMKIIAICRNEFEMCLDQKNMSDDVKGFLRFDRGAHAWKRETERQFIVAIRNIYLKHLELKPENITFSMSKIFEACDLWPEGSNYYETMRKRIQSINGTLKDPS